MRPRWWRRCGTLEFDQPLGVPLVLVPQLHTLPSTGGLYPNSLACSEAAYEAICGVLFVGLPLTATTELVAGKLKAVELANDNEATLPRCLFV